MHHLIVDLLLVLHAGFIVFVVFGGLLVFRRPHLAWLHVPAAAWGAAVELAGLRCPLTLLENHFRSAAGMSVYTDDFVTHYLVAFIYPAGLTPVWQLVLGVGVIAINAAVYGSLLARRHRRMA
jgi:hypothetical protein